MILEGTRFGSIDLDEDRIIEFPRGLIGFASERRFVLLEPPSSRRVAWLQSLDAPTLAFPVVDALTFDAGYAAPVRVLAQSYDICPEDAAILLVVVAREGQRQLSANLLAPIIVDVRARTAIQVVLDHKRFKAAHPLPAAARAPTSAAAATATSAACAAPICP